MPNTTPARETTKPTVGITTDIRTIEHLERRVGIADYAAAVTNAGGTPVFLDTNPAHIPAYLEVCSAFILTGGDDPLTEHWTIPTHTEAKRVHPDRQAFELALLTALDEWALDHAPHPTLGVCLGMQYMALHAGGTLDQHLPETSPTHADHWDQDHPITGDFVGTVHSRHRQAITDPGSLRVAATAHDDTIEAINRLDRLFYLGVQWHPERTASPETGADIFKALITACKS